MIATESYQEFAEQLQKEIEADTGIRFGVVQRHDFAAIPVVAADGTVTPLGVPASEALWQYFEQVGYVDARGKVLDALRVALKSNAVDVPPAFDALRPQVREILRKLAGSLEIRNANERRTITPNHEVLEREDFRRLWERIKHRTTYRVEFDNEQLIRDCTTALRDAPRVAQARVQVRKASIAIGRGGVEATETATAAPATLEERGLVLPDILTVLQDATQLTRRTLARVLGESDRLDDFARNPQHFLEIATEAINRTKRLALVAGIRYQRIGNDDFYAQQLFEERELIGYMKNTIPSNRSPYDFVAYDSETVELPFAQKLETNDAIKVYAKLPGWFTVPTPLGTYNPDWAILVERDGCESVYLVVETKHSQYADDLRSREGARIACGTAHFRALSVGERPAEYRVERSFDEMMATLQCTPS